ncbi:hypothetical protein KO493_15620 [Tamlana agarivorans]|uniref:Uncharacterized protein n=1 Tax=Pseudotamlana agarivorans TaxID=481183 RepID=A0ACC5UCY2_9FLAO|nr:hypothetical protein [Tamlana agarivorans]MBU2952129.1 hypothetical protein [Tamlana agarivorans]
MEQVKKLWKLSLLLIVCFCCFSCKNSKGKSANDKKELLTVKSIVFLKEDFEFVISLSSSQIYKFEAIELLFNSSVEFIKINSNSFRFTNGDHYGNHVTMLFNFNTTDCKLYLRRIDGFFPLKHDVFGRDKYCIMEKIELDISEINGEELFDKFATQKYCEIKNGE